MKGEAFFARADVVELALSNVAFAGMQIYIPWLAASQVPLSELAMLSLAQSFVWPLAMVAQLQMRTLYVARGDRALFPVFVQLRLAACILLVVCTAVLSVFLGQGHLLVAIAVTLALVKAVESVADLMHAELQRTMAVRPAARSQAWRCTIFIGVYTIAIVASGDLVVSLTAALACMTCWVLAVDVGGRAFWREVLAHGVRLESLLPTLRIGTSLSLAVALTSLAMMIGRWAAQRAGDTETVAAAALAGTAGSVVTVVLAITLNYSLVPARMRLEAGGLPAFRRWCSVVTKRLHMLMATLVLAWIAASALLGAGALPLMTGHDTPRLHDTVIVLAGCFIVAGWLGVLCFADSMLLYLQERHTTILLIAVLQVMAAMAASLLLYPYIGWIAIGIAEIVRSLAFVAAVRFTGERLQPAGNVAG